jgi:hypothetical protein
MRKRIAYVGLLRPLRQSWYVGIDSSHVRSCRWSGGAAHTKISIVPMSAAAVFPLNLGIGLETAHATYL